MAGFGKLLVPIVASIVLLAFASDVVADNICRATGCAEMTADASHEDESDGCGHCMCATHAGAIVVPAVSGAPLPRRDPAANVFAADENAPEALPVPIDHPPQLA